MAVRPSPFPLRPLVWQRPSGDSMTQKQVLEVSPVLYQVQSSWQSVGAMDTVGPTGGGEIVGYGVHPQLSPHASMASRIRPSPS